MIARVSIALISLLMIALICDPCEAGKNLNGRWGLHIAGVHDSEANTCDLRLEECWQIHAERPPGPERYDIYVIAIDVGGVAKTRFGIYGDSRFYFYGFTACSDHQAISEGWPGCGQGCVLSWDEEQPGPIVTLGILDVYVYGHGRLWTGPDASVGYAEFCDASQPTPVCDVPDEPYGVISFGRVGYGRSCVPCGSHYCCCLDFDLETYARCDTVPAGGHTWGEIKALYR